MWGAGGGEQDWRTCALCLPLPGAYEHWPHKNLPPSPSAGDAPGMKRGGGSPSPAEARRLLPGFAVCVRHQGRGWDKLADLLWADSLGPRAQGRDGLPRPSPGKLPKRSLTLSRPFGARFPSPGLSLCSPRAICWNSNQQRPENGQGGRRPPYLRFSRSPDLSAAGVSRVLTLV